LPKRPKHNDKDLENLLKEAENKNWRVDGGGNKHFKMFCPCHEKHKKTIATTPSSGRYLQRTRTLLENQTCWSQVKDEEP
jgi:hypothetical protein